MTDATTIVRADIRRLEVGIKQLKVQYDMFFAGALPKEPSELRISIEDLIRRTSNVSIQRYADRFLFNTLVSRFNSLSELWGRTLRDREEGDRASRSTLEREARDGERVLDVCRIQDAANEQEHLKQLHARYLEARRSAAKNGGKVSFSAFMKGISAQARKIRERTGCEEVELRLVVHHDQVQLKARPGKK